MARRKYPRDPLWIASRPLRVFSDPDYGRLSDRPYTSTNFLDDSFAIRSPLTEVEDRREFYPDDRPVRSSRRRVTQIKAVPIRPGRPFRSPFFSAGVLAFHAPKFVAVCIRRKRRREVIFAKRKFGRGNRRGRRNSLSNIRC